MDSLTKLLVKDFLPESIGGKEVTALFGGGFKPPTAGHLEVIQKALKNHPEIDNIIVYVGSKVRDGITQDQSFEIWNKHYKQLIDKPVRVEKSVSPIGDIYRYAKDNPEDSLYWIIGSREGREDDLQDISSRSISINKYPNLNLKTIITPDGGMSGTNARKALMNNDKEAFKFFLPSNVNQDEVWNILSSQPLNEIDFKRYLDKAKKGFSKFIEALKQEKQETKDAFNLLVQAVKEKKELSSEEKKEIGNQLKDIFKTIGYVGLFALPGGSIFTILFNLLKLNKYVLPSAFLDKEGLNEADPKKGTGKKPKGSGRRLYTDEDPSDTVKVKFSTRQDIIDTLNKKPFKAKSHARQSQIINLIHQRVRAALGRTKDPQKKAKLRSAFEYIKNKKEASKKKTQRLKKQKNENVAPNHDGKAAPFGSGYKKLNENATYSSHIDYKQEIKDLTKHMLKKGMNIKPLPKVVFKHDDKENAQSFLGKTAYYDPNNMMIVLYTEGRHPKDIARSYAHEMIHHIQNLEDRLENITTTNTMEDDHLNDIEREAYTRGNMVFRNYTDGKDGEEVTSLNEKEKPYKHKHGFDKNLGKDPFGLNQYARELASLEEGVSNIRLIQGGANPNPPTTFYHGSGYKFDLSSLSFSRTGELKGLGGFGSSSERCAGLYTFAYRKNFNPVRAEGIIFIQQYPNSSARSYARGTWNRKKTERAYVYKIEADKDIMLLNQGAPSCFNVKDLDKYVYDTKIKYKEFDGIGSEKGEIILWDKKHIKSMTPILVGVPNPLKFDGRQGAAWEELDKKFKLTGKWKELFWFDSEEKANNFVANKDKWIQYIMDKYAPIGEPKVTQNPLTENMLKEGRYDTLSNQISRDIFQVWKEDFKEGDEVSTYEDTYDFPPRGIDVKAQIQFKPGSKQLKVDGGSDEARVNPKTKEKLPGYLEVTFEIDPEMLPEFWEEISMNLKDVVRHEIEHITQSGDSKTKNEKFEDDSLVRALVKAKLISQANYFELPKEVDANLQGMYFRAKKEKIPFGDIINTYLDAQDITLKEKEKILDLWRSRRKALSLPKF